MRDQIQCGILRTLYDVWAANCASNSPGTPPGGRLPALADIDPAQIAGCLPNLIILDVEERPRRYRYRFVGTAVDAKSGQYRTGKYLDEIDLGKLKRRTIAMMDRVADDRTPSHFIGEYQDREGCTLRYERVAMPLSSDGARVDAILVGKNYVPLGIAPADVVDRILQRRQRDLESA